MPRAALRDPRRAIALVTFVTALAPLRASAQEIQTNIEADTEAPAPRAPVMVAVPPWLEGANLECLKRARTRAQMIDCVKPDQVSVHAKPPARSASDWEVDEETIRAAPHQSGADVLNVVPGCS
jgi:hypothetical protein